MCYNDVLHVDRFMVADFTHVTHTHTHLQLFSPLLCECLVLVGERQSVVLCQRPEVEVVPGIRGGGDVDVELELLQIDPLQLVPACVSVC